MNPDTLAMKVIQVFRKHDFDIFRPPFLLGFSKILAESILLLPNTKGGRKIKENYASVTPERPRGNLRKIFTRQILKNDDN